MSFKLGKYLFFLFLLYLFGNTRLNAQDIAFSQYYHTPFFINPALSAYGKHQVERDINLNKDIFYKTFQVQFGYRYQPLASGDNFSTPVFSFAYPFFNRETKALWGGIGFTLLTDQQSDFLRTSGFSLSYAHHFHFGRQHLSFGFQPGVFFRSFDINSIIVDNQIIGGVFNPDASINESFLNENKTYLTLNTGLTWRLDDNRGREKLKLGFSVNNLNEPDNSFLGTVASRVPRNISLIGSVFFLRENDFFLEPNFRYTNRLGFNYVFAGSWFHYQPLSRKTLQKDTKLSFGAWYNSNRALTLALRYDQPKYFTTFSYDIPTGSESNSWLGSGGIEFTLGIKFRSRIKDPKPDQAILDTLNQVIEDTAYVSNLDSLEKERREETPSFSEVDSLAIPPTDTMGIPGPDTDSLLVQETREDSTFTRANPSEKEDEKSIVVEIPTRVEFSRKILEFGLGGMNISFPSRQTLDELSELLQLYPDTRIQIIGYTCDLGDQQQNLALSLQRAEVVKQYLTNLDISDDRIEVIGRGEENPIASNSTEEGKQMNRRVEITPLPQK